MSSQPSADEVRLVVTSEDMSGLGRPSEYGMALPNTAQNLWIFQGDSSSKNVSRAAGTAHMIPKRDSKYSAILKERLNRADLTVQHRTQHDEIDHDNLRGSVHLFQRPSAEETERSKSLSMLAGSPDSQASSRMSKRMKALDEMPQQESRQASVPATRNLDDAIMQILVNRDTGWPLQQLSKAVKEAAGASVNMAQLKSKLLEICVYQRRGEDTHPKYYLKSEYK